MATRARHPRGVSHTPKPTIQLTKEMESNDQLNFLNVLVKRHYHGYQTSVYKKATHTDLYTHFTSHHHPSVKTATIKCLKRRAETINMWWSGMSRRTTALERGLPCQQLPGQCNRENLNTYMQTRRLWRKWQWKWEAKDPVPPLCQRSLRNNTEDVRENGGEDSVQITNEGEDEDNRRDIVYHIPCQDCESSYIIVETGKTLKKRITEHKAAVLEGQWRRGSQSTRQQWREETRTTEYQGPATSCGLGGCQDHRLWITLQEWWRPFGSTRLRSTPTLTEDSHLTRSGHHFYLSRPSKMTRFYLIHIHLFSVIFLSNYSVSPIFSSLITCYITYTSFFCALTFNQLTKVFMTETSWKPLMPSSRNTTSYMYLQWAYRIWYSMFTCQSNGTFCAVCNFF